MKKFMSVLLMFIMVALGVSMVTSISSFAKEDVDGTKAGLEFLVDDGYDDDPFEELNKEAKQLSASGYQLGRTIILAIITFAFLGIVAGIILKKNGNDLKDIKFNITTFIIGVLLFFGIFKILDMIAEIATGL